jgi:hypothetical protein
MYESSCEDLFIAELNERKYVADLERYSESSSALSPLAKFARVSTDRMFVQALITIS